MKLRGQPDADEKFQERALAYAIASRLLAYPDQDLIDQLPLIKAGCATLAPSVRENLDRYFEAVAGQSLLQQQAAYVSTFDLKRRCCLYLTYYLNGDTRRRGSALWRFQETFRWAGWQVEGGELPDYLPVVLEFASTDPQSESAALSLLGEHLQGLEVLRTALAKFHSPQEHVLVAVLELLPELSPAQMAAAAMLVAEGPPMENVGLTPFNLTDITVGARS